MRNPLNNYFDKIFLISIKRNQERLDTFLKNNPDLEVEVIQGIDGQALYPSLENVWYFPQSFFIEYQLDYDHCKQWNKGQLGCAMSNLLVQKEILKRKLQKVLILEDDAKLLSLNITMFDKAIKELPLDWDLFYLGYNSPTKWAEHKLSRLFVKLKHLIKPVFTENMSSRTITKRYFSSSYSRYLKIAGVYAGTHAYGLSYEGAKKIVTLDTPLKHGFDTTLMYANYNKLIKGFALKRPLFIPNPKFETTLVN